ncbi:MAG: photosystem reaction center subunit H [Anaeromyxobacter sp. RBG_16_69_14]|nr:MAG: photosystem reaction center subunit H [Anaeromyxobacter sp. RBG_16_69_14]
MLLATAASAQQETQAPQPPPVAGSITLGVTVEESTAVAIGYRASKLIGAIVYNYNDRNAKIGKIGDLIVKPDGTLSLAIVDVSGFLGIGRHHVAIPVGQFTSVKPKIVLPGATKEALKRLRRGAACAESTRDRRARLVYPSACLS